MRKKLKYIKGDIAAMTNQDFTEHKGDCIPKKKLKKLTLNKPWTPSGVQLETGTMVFVGEYRAMQLASKGFGSIDFDTSNTIETHKKAADRRKPEEKPQVVEHKFNIEEDGSEQLPD